MRFKLVYAGCVFLWLVLSTLAALSIASLSLLGAEQQFNSHVQQLTEQLKQRLLINETILDSYTTFSTLDYRNDSRHPEPLAPQLLQRYPQLTSLALIRRVPESDVAAFNRQLQRNYGPGWRLRPYADDPHSRQALPPRAEYFPLLFSEWRGLRNQHLIGMDLSQQPAISAALQDSLISGHAALSRQLRLGDSTPGYLLLRGIENRYHRQFNDLLPTHFAALFFRADSLLPKDARLPEGMQAQLQHRDDPLYPVNGYGMVLGDNRASPLERWLFPRLEATQLLGGGNLPLRLTVSWQQGWAQIGAYEWGVWLLLSLLLLLGMGLACHSFVRNNHSRRQREQHLFYLANHDRLTGLANRNLFYDRLQHAINRVNRSGKRLALLFLDLDRFKPVNDTYGHVIGDRVLQQIALRIKEVVRSEDTVARIGGDEFVILMEDIESNREADKVVGRLKQAIQRPYLVEAHQIRVGVSIGIAYYPEDGLLIDELLAVADRKMYGNKQAPQRNGEAVL
ncbi:sensor domain-containing diguanylate cyclase [Xenophilus sp. AP218F]|nr:sensor domain-containing diguanylate cyclase [Chromobacterium sp. ASV5]OWY38114.1 sensor domain-containing diguanylate cyclase [Xenophilus sp. AP218F]